MLKNKYYVPLLVFIIALLWPLSAIAEDLTPNTCLRKDGREYEGRCYVSNIIHPGTRTATDPDGTQMAPWLAEGQAEFENIKSNVQSALQNPDHTFGTGSFFLALINCDPSGSRCRTDWYEYDDDGEEIWHRTDDIVPPEVGVPLPFPYILGGGAVLGTLLVGIGVVLRYTVRRRS